MSAEPVRALLDRLKKAGHILLEGQPESDDPGITVTPDVFAQLPAGTLAFYDVYVFSEDEFHYRSAEAQATPHRGREREPDIDVDLREIDEKMHAFTRHVGEDAAVMVIAPIQGVLIKTVHHAPWFDAFRNLSIKATAPTMRRVQELLEKRDAQGADRHAVHVVALGRLRDDADFVRLARLHTVTLNELYAYASAHQREAVAALGQARTLDLIGELRKELTFHN